MLFLTIQPDRKILPTGPARFFSTLKGPVMWLSDVTRCCTTPPLPKIPQLVTQRSKPIPVLMPLAIPLWALKRLVGTLAATATPRSAITRCLATPLRHPTQPPVPRRLLITLPAPSTRLWGLVLLLPVLLVIATQRSVLKRLMTTTVASTTRQSVVLRYFITSPAISTPPLAMLRCLPINLAAAILPSVPARSETALQTTTRPSVIMRFKTIPPATATRPWASAQAAASLQPMASFVSAPVART